MTRQSKIVSLRNVRMCIVVDCSVSDRKLKLSARPTKKEVTGNPCSMLIVQVFPPTNWLVCHTRPGWSHFFVTFLS